MPDPRPPLRHVQRRFWLLIRAGFSVADAAADVGAGRRTGQRWFVEAGGMSPVAVEVSGSPTRLSVEDRELIARGLAQGRSHRQIAASMGRHHATVSREVRRNVGHRRDQDPAGDVGVLTGPGAAAC
jgi:transposase, IS30 family